MQMNIWKILPVILLPGCIALATALYFNMQELQQARQSAVQAESLATASKTQTETTSSLTSNYQNELFNAHIRIAALATAKEQYDEANSALLSTSLLESGSTPQELYRRNLLAGYLNIIRQDKAAEYLTDTLTLYAAKVSPDGRWLAVGGENGYLAIYGMISGQLKRRLEGHPTTTGRAGSITSLGFAQDGSLLSAGGDGTIIHWSLPGGEIINQFKTNTPVMAMSTSPVANLFATGDIHGHILIRAISDGKIIKSFKAHERAISPPNGLAFSANGKLLASASLDSTARIWDTSSGKLLHTLKGHDSALTSAAFNQDSQLLVTADNRGKLLVWATTTGTPLRMLKLGGVHEEAIHHAIFSDDQRRIYAAGEESGVRVWDLIGGKAMRELSGQSSGYWSLTIHQQNLLGATNGRVDSWKLKEPGQWQWETGGEPITTCLSAEGDLAATGFSDGSIRFFQLPGGEEPGSKLQAHQQALSSIAYSKDNKRLASAADGVVKIWLTRDPSYPVELELEMELPAQEKPIRALAFAPDGRQLAIAVDDGSVILYDTATKSQQDFLAHPGGVTSVAYDDSGEKLLTAATKTRMAKVWNLKNGTATLHHAISDLTGRPHWATFSPDGKHIALAGGGGFIGSAASSAGAEDSKFTSFPAKHKGNALRIAYTPDGGTLATIGSDARLRLIDSTNGRELFSLELPSVERPGIPSALDLDLRCNSDYCDLLIPLTSGRVVLYRIDYGHYSPQG